MFNSAMFILDGKCYYKRQMIYRYARVYSFQVEWKPDKILFALPLVTQFWADKIEFTFLTLSWWCVSKWIYLRNLFMSQVNWNVAWNFMYGLIVGRYQFQGNCIFSIIEMVDTLTLLIERCKTEELTKFNECMHINIHRLNS